jgi:hypothetical protein
LEFRSDVLLSSTADRSVEKAYRRGKLVRMAPGWYMSREAWDQAKPWERLPLMCTAMTLSNPSTCFAGTTAAQLLGLPGSHRLEAIHTDVAPGAHSGTLTRTFNVAPGFKAVAPPARMSHSRGLPWDGRACSVYEYRVVPPEIAALEVSLWEPFVHALQVMDAMLRAVSPFNIGRGRLEEIIDQWPVKSQAKLARRVLDLADPRAESPMESLIRAICYLFGLEPPEIQVEFRDADGQMIVDFYWPRIGLVVEYDGQGKWMDPQLDTGRAQWGRIHQHNTRHDRLLALREVTKVLHLTSEHLRDVNALVALLIRSGVRQDRRRAERFPRGLR